MCGLLGRSLFFLDVQNLVDGLLRLGESRASEAEAAIEPAHGSLLWAWLGGITCDVRETFLARVCERGDLETFSGGRQRQSGAAMSAKDQMSKLLDQLMGQNRDGEFPLS